MRDLCQHLLWVVEAPFQEWYPSKSAWMNDLIFQQIKKKHQNIFAPSCSGNGRPGLGLCTFLCCGGGFSPFQDGIGKLLPELVQSTKDAWQGNQSSLVKKPWKSNGWKPRIGDLEAFLRFQGRILQVPGV